MRIVALAITIAMLVSINTTAFSAESIGAVEDIQVSSFVDGEGKVNTVHVSSESIGTAHVDYYIEDIFVSTVDVEILGLQKTRGASLDDTGNVRVTYTDVATSKVEVFTDSVSNYVVTSPVCSDVAILAQPAANTAYTYQGQINYNTYYSSYGDTFNDSLSIYQEEGNTTYTYKTINAAEGAFASVLIAVVAAALTVICPVLEVLATNLIYAAAYAAGTTILGGIVQGAIEEEYYVRTTPYHVKAYDASTSRENIYDAERYQVALNGGGYSSEYYYDGYLPWDDDTVAYWMFCDFWSYSYPGVRSYT